MNIDKHQLYMKLAEVIATASHATRSKVGALLERDGNIIAFGYNGTPSGFDNDCEVKKPLLNVAGKENYEVVTKMEVLHAETNAIAKCARSAISSSGSNLYVTVSPCFECAKLIIQAGIISVYYRQQYRTTDGLYLLNKAGIQTIWI